MKKFCLVLLASCLGLAPLAQAADINAGKTKAAACAACHGADGNKSIDPSYPKLAGQHRDFLLRALLDYKSGARKNAIMQGQVANLSKRDLQDLAAYFASLPGELDSRK